MAINENELQLIQIGEFEQTLSLLGEGAEYVVIRKADGKTYKMSTADFKNYIIWNLPEDLTRTEFIYEKFAPGSALPDPGREASVFLGAGTYSVPGGGASLVLTENFNVVSWDGEEWVKLLEVPVEVPEPDLSGLVEKSSIVNNLEEGGSNKVASAEAVKTLRGNIEALATVRTGANLIDPSKIVRGKRVGTVASGGNIYPFELGIMTDYIPVEEGVMYGLVGINQSVSSYFKEIGDTAPVYVANFPNTTVPEGLGIKYMVANISISGDESSIASAMIYKRTSGAIPYEPYTEEWKIKPSALPSEGDARDVTVPLTWGVFAVATGNASTRPANFNRVITFDFYKTEGLNQISVASGFMVSFYAFDEAGQGTFLYRSAYAQGHARDSFKDYNYLRFTVQKTDDTAITISDIQNINLTLGLSVEADEYTSDKSEVILVDIVRGALSANGSVINNNATDAQDRDEFYKNFKTQKFIRVDGRLNSSIWVDQTGLSAYTIWIFQFDKNHSLISLSAVTDTDHGINPNTRYVRLHGHKTDLSDIAHLPTVNIRAVWSGDVYGYSTSPYKKTERLVIQVGNYNGMDAQVLYQLEDPDPTPQSDNDAYYTHMIIRTPKNYSPDGSPCRVLWFAHGSSDAFVNNFSPSYTPYLEYLVDEGFMIIDVFGWSNKYPNAIHNLGTPTGRSCVNSMYRFVSENYNIKRDGVFVLGKSIGGLQVYSAEYAYNFPVLAVAGLSGQMEMVSNLFGYGDNDRLAVIADLGISEDPAPILSAGGVLPYYTNLDARAWLLRNAKYFKAMVPLFGGAINLAPEDMFPQSGNLHTNYINMEFTAISRVPAKEWISPDESGRMELILARKRAVEKGGGIFEIRYMPLGVSDPHHAVDTMGQFIPQITTRLGIVHYGVPVAYAEALQFFRRFEI